VAYVLYRSQTVAINFILSFSYAVVFNFNVFSLPPSKTKFSSDIILSTFFSCLHLLDLARADSHVNLQVAVVDKFLFALFTLEPFSHL